MARPASDSISQWPAFLVTAGEVQAEHLATQGQIQRRCLLVGTKQPRFLSDLPLPSGRWSRAGGPCSRRAGNPRGQKSAVPGVARKVFPRPGNDESGPEFDPDQSGADARARCSHLDPFLRCRYEHSRYVLSGVGAGRIPGLRGRARLLFAPVSTGHQSRHSKSSPSTPRRPMPRTITEVSKLGEMYVGLTRSAYKPIEQAVAKKWVHSPPFDKKTRVSRLGSFCHPFLPTASVRSIAFGPPHHVRSLSQSRNRGQGAVLQSLTDAVEKQFASVRVSNIDSR
jgi:hypothetical protein